MHCSEIHICQYFWWSSISGIRGQGRVQSPAGDGAVDSIDLWKLTPVAPTARSPSPFSPLFISFPPAVYIHALLIPLSCIFQSKHFSPCQSSPSLLFLLMRLHTHRLPLFCLHCSFFLSLYISVLFSLFSLSPPPHSTPHPLSSLSYIATPPRHTPPQPPCLPAM